jgi:hypothetical protein
MLRFIAESNAGDQGAGNDNITNFFRSLIFSTLLEIAQLFELQRRPRYLAICKDSGVRPNNCVSVNMIPAGCLFRLNFCLPNYTIQESPTLGQIDAYTKSYQIYSQYSPSYIRL